MRRRVFLAFLAMWTLAFPALAQSRHGSSLDRVLPEIRRNVPGTFYDAEGPFFGPGGQASYRIKWMTPDGRIVWFYADARTGRVMGMGGMPPFGSRRNDFQDRFRDGDWPPSGGDSERGRWRDNRGGDWGGRGGRGGDNGGRGGHGGDGGGRGGDHGGRGSGGRHGG